MTTKRTIGTAAVVAALGLGLLSASVVKTGAAAQQPAYKSSIQVTDDGDGRKGDQREGRRRRDGESAEAARLASLAKVDEGQATAAAVGRVPGTALRTALENEDENVVYEVQIRTAAGQIHDVKVDAGTGAVLHVDAPDDDGDGEEDDD
jgi:uncharacterized membrane protein YkoI